MFRFSIRRVVSCARCLDSVTIPRCRFPNSADIPNGSRSRLLGERAFGHDATPSITMNTRACLRFLAPFSCGQAGHKDQQCNCGSQVMDFHLTFIPHTQFLAIGQYNLFDTAEGGTAFGHSTHGDRDFLADLEGLDGNAEIDQGGWIVPLPEPVHDVAVLIFTIELQEGMGIGPTPLRDNALDGDGLVVVSGISVMRKYGKD